MNAASQNRSHAEVSVAGLAVQVRAEHPSCCQYRHHVAADDTVAGSIVPDGPGKIGEGNITKIVSDRCR
jgi:hypothetical protein